MIEPEKLPETDLVQEQKAKSAMEKKRDYNVSDKVLARNQAAAESSALARRTRIQDKMAEKLDVIVNSMTAEEIADASFKDRATAAGIFYDKLYRDNKATPNQAIQINIQTVGVPQDQIEPLMIDITPQKEG